MELIYALMRLYDLAGESNSAARYLIPKHDIANALVQS